MPMDCSFRPHADDGDGGERREQGVDQCLPSRIAITGRDAQAVWRRYARRGAGLGLVEQAIAVEGDEADLAAEKNADRRTRKSGRRAAH